MEQKVVLVTRVEKFSFSVLNAGAEVPNISRLAPLFRLLRMHFLFL